VSVIETNPFASLTQIAGGYCLARSLHVVADLGVADALDETLYLLNTCKCLRMNLRYVPAMRLANALACSNPTLVARAACRPSPLRTLWALSEHPWLQDLHLRRSG